MTDDLHADPTASGPDAGLDAPLEPDQPDQVQTTTRTKFDEIDPPPDTEDGTQKPPTGGPLAMKEGADAPDAADIDDPDTQL